MLKSRDIKDQHPFYYRVLVIGVGAFATAAIGVGAVFLSQGIGFTLGENIGGVVAFAGVFVGGASVVVLFTFAVILIARNPRGIRGRFTQGR